jgi:hypothetical protein
VPRSTSRSGSAGAPWRVQYSRTRAFAGSCACLGVASHRDAAIAIEAEHEPAREHLAADHAVDPPPTDVERVLLAREERQRVDVQRADLHAGKWRPVAGVADGRDLRDDLDVDAGRCVGIEHEQERSLAADHHRRDQRLLRERIHERECPRLPRREPRRRPDHATTE